MAARKQDTSLVRQDLDESWETQASRGLHVHVRRQIEEALDGRSWKWLAARIGVPQSTLAGQVCKPKFSLEIVWKIARELDLELDELVGTRKRESDSR